MRPVPKTTIVLANSSHARWVEPTRTGFSAEAEYAAEVSHQHRSRAAIFESASPMRHSAGETDFHAKDRDRFAAEIAERLNAEQRRGELQQLVLVAPPKMLLAIRNALSAAARAKIVVELSRDLVKTPLHELGDWLSTVSISRTAAQDRRPNG